MLRPTVIYDACVLYPAPLRDFLLQLACEGLFRARWTHAIHEEWTRNLLKAHPDLNPKALARTCQLMDRAVPNALIKGHETLIEGLALPDPDDRHVLAAAIHGRAQMIVTFNLKDFPATALKEPMRGRSFGGNLAAGDDQFVEPDLTGVACFHLHAGNFLDHLDAGNHPGELSEETPHDGAGVMCTEAIVVAEAEGDMGVGFAFQIDLIGILENLRSTRQRRNFFVWPFL